MYEVTGYHVMLDALRGIRKLTEKRIHKPGESTLIQKYFKGKELRAEAVISLNGGKNRYFVKGLI